MVATYQRKQPVLRKDNFYGSTQSRLRTYTSDRRVEEQNGNIQQAKVYKQLAEERGDLETADRLSKLGTMIINKFGQQVQAQPVSSTQPITEQPFDIRNYLKQAIKNGTLSNIWDSIKKISDKNLSPVAKVIKSDIKKNKFIKDLLNETLIPSTIIAQSNMKSRENLGDELIKYYHQLPDAEISAKVDDVIKILTGSKENEPALTELLQQAGGLETIADRVNKQINVQRNKFGSKASSEASTEQGTELPPLHGRPQFSDKESLKSIKTAIDNLESKIQSANPTRDVTNHAYRIDPKDLPQSYKRKLYAFVEKKGKTSKKYPYKFGPEFISAVEYLLQ